MGEGFIMAISITEIRNARSLNEENTMFDVEINHPLFGWIGYMLDPSDTDQTINNSELRSLIGSDFAAYVAPTQDELDDVAEQEVRGKRNYKLKKEVDPLVSNHLRWNDLTDTQRTAWTQYRIDLLNIPQQAGFPHNVTWPTKPS